ncbi:hypothetical protein ACR78F_07460 [Sphingobacterium spiritivorum]|uniref:hypothetical protein n=1 Tax=Sphingobacterium TaxID=28453 RepID=UPI0011C03FBB|nr:MULTISPECIES: hypothetical protein [Sphingobacterium]QQS95679.1 hypothetical protein I6J03_20255 [Sphingobacterium spiritivorum]QQT25652.1 hypothetical protein I6J02_18340 [Sphingobacterium spiritivorum]
MKGIGSSRVGTGNGQRTRNDPLLPIYSKLSELLTSVRTDRAIACQCAFSILVSPSIGLPHFRKISHSSRDNASLLNVKDRPCSAIAADALTCPLQAGR